MKRCYGCFKKLQEEETFCRSCRKRIFSGKTIDTLLDFDKHEYIEIKQRLGDHFSISGVQDKISLRIEHNRLTPVDRSGQYILKPVPQTRVPRFQNDVPANEHLTMQIAKQIFKITTAENAFLHFSDGEPAYIVKRFDVTAGEKLHQEDFCQLLEISEESHGKHYKYDLSYENAASVIDKFTATPLIQKESFFQTLLFNYLIGNGDAHLKNFSLIETVHGDFILSPLYDALSTTLHFPNEQRTALDLFDNYETESFRLNGFYTSRDFIEFAGILGLKEARTSSFIDFALQQKERVLEMIALSFLSEKAQAAYRDIYLDRIKAITL